MDKDGVVARMIPTLQGKLLNTLGAIVVVQSGDAMGEVTNASQWCIFVKNNTDSVTNGILGMEVLKLNLHKKKWSP